MQVNEKLNLALNKLSQAPQINAVVYGIKIGAIWTFPNLRLYLRPKQFSLKLFASYQPIVLFKMQLNPKMSVKRNVPCALKATSRYVLMNTDKFFMCAYN